MLCTPHLSGSVKCPCTERSDCTYCTCVHMYRVVLIAHHTHASSITTQVHLPEVFILLILPSFSLRSAASTNPEVSHDCTDTAGHNHNQFAWELDAGTIRRGNLFSSCWSPGGEIMGSSRNANLSIVCSSLRVKRQGSFCICPISHC